MYYTNPSFFDVLQALKENKAKSKQEESHVVLSTGSSRRRSRFDVVKE